jgi:type IV pilus assembly protein PilW
MISMVISLILMLAIVEIVVVSKTTYTVDEGLSRIQENARFALDYLSKDIRMAGYLGCNSKLSGTKVGNIVDPPNDATSFSQEGLRGYRHTCTSSCTGALAEWSPALPADYFTAGQVRPYTDVIIIERATDFGTHLTGNTVPSNANIQILDTASIKDQIKAEDVLIVSDCKAADIFRTTNDPAGGSGKLTIAHSNAGNIQPQLTHSYGNDAQLMKLVSHAYYIGTGSSGEPSLFRKELNIGVLTPQELVEGIETMKIMYGEDTNAGAATSPTRYIAPASVTDWVKVLSVRLGIIGRTPAAVGAEKDTNTYDVLGDTTSSLDDFDPTDDGRRRRVFNTTIRVRNH